MPRLRFDRQFDVDGPLLLTQSTAQLRKRDVLQLTNSFAGYAEFLADFLKRLGLATVETKPLENNFLLAIIEHVEQSADFVPKILVPQQLERRLRFFVSDDLAKFRGIIVTDRRIERSRPNRNSLKLRNFSAGNTELVAELLIGGLAPEFLTHLQGYTAHLGNLVHQMYGQTDGLALIGQSSLDRLFDPPRG